MRGEGPSRIACASISRVLYPTLRLDLCHLSGMPLAEHLDRPTLRIPTLRQGAAGSSCSGIHGLSARGVYQAACVATSTGGLLLCTPKRTIPREGGPTFSLLPAEALAKEGLAKYFSLRPFGLQETSLSAALSVTPPFPVVPLPVRKHGALRCPDFPPEPLRDRAAERCTGCQRTQLPTSTSAVTQDDHFRCPGTIAPHVGIVELDVIVEL